MLTLDASDYRLIAAVLDRAGVPHDGYVTASLDHALWWAYDVDATDWWRFSHRAVVATGGRALIEGAVATGPGEVVARFTQEALLRPIDVDEPATGAS